MRYTVTEVDDGQLPDSHTWMLMVRECDCGEEKTERRIIVGKNALRADPARVVQEVAEAVHHWLK